jgi:phosphomannomutase
MDKEKAALAGEMSGHIYFADKFYGFDDGIYAFIRLLSYLERNNLVLQNVIDGLNKTISSAEIKIPVQDKFTLVEKIKTNLTKRKVNFLDIDGVRVTRTDRSWYLIRASNTEDILVVRCEGLTQEQFNLILKDLKNTLEEVGIKNDGIR